mgnify:CR=1 FL=1
MQKWIQQQIIIDDTTLRDGEQAPGCSMTQAEKLRVAKALAELGVDVIEAGFPAASPGDWESVNAVAREVQGPIICGLARATRDDIEKVARAVAPAARRRIHVFLATSAIHRQYKLNMAKDEIIRSAVEGVKMARDLCEDVEFSPEDASRTELEFLAQVVEAVIDAGAVRFRPMLLTAMAVVVGGAVILADPIFQGLAISLMAGEIASLLISRMAVPVLYFMAHSKDKTAP